MFYTNFDNINIAVSNNQQPLANFEIQLFRHKRFSFIMWQYYQDKTIFLTGATGSLGTAVLHRLMSKGDPRRVYVLCRGGYRNASAKWKGLLPESMANSLLQNPLITILAGDLMSTNMGLYESDWKLLKESVNIVIHTASPINLRSSLTKLSSSVIEPSIFLARISLQMPGLQRFVFVSTAYANSHLWSLNRDSDVTVTESIYPLNTTHTPSKEQRAADYGMGAEEEWTSVQMTGTTNKYEAYDFPWPYTYAKHLTERLLLQLFAQSDATQKLLIIRPSVFGPAIRYPFPNFSRPSSTPSAGIAASILMYPGRQFKFASRGPDPFKTATIDEVPVDVVTDRLLAHLAYETTGCVHAVSGKKDRSSLFEDMWPALMKERRLPWKVKPVWISQDWHSQNLHPTAQLFIVMGASFDFTEEQTEKLAAKMTEQERSDLILFTDGRKATSIVERRHHIREMGLLISRNTHFPSWVAKVLCRPGKRQQDEFPLCEKPEDNGFHKGRRVDVTETEVHIR
ncbi:hypothetical protein N7462_004480 [Penicillium macrosclerotiorum]|uniref:uncharacterized protein n=1 Tax=Penicillium macrosclerotiorum TaxID=303699 RepID=UPI0025483FA4|nr:uncharacterized protein N7462_004480 [Penicillium macrosclerotiorum]KAJ5690088.1 hypothetical protein N7462_004480 [Penicillium macrosclerotiorum]